MDKTQKGCSKGKGKRKYREVRRKLDPKLAFALSLPLEELRKRKAKEDKQLAEIAKEIRECKERIEEKKQEQKPIKEDVYPKLFAPLFSGIYFPIEGKPIRPSKFEIPYASVFIRFHGSRKDLEELGVQVGSQAGDIFTAFVPLELIEELEAMPSVEYIELARPTFQDLDEAVPTAEIDQLHSATPGVTGQGVIVGVIDTRLDIYHPNFRHDDGAGTDNLGSTRVLRLWDQTLAHQSGEATPYGNDPSLGSGFDYGVDYGQADINNELNKPGTDPAYQIVRHGGTTSEHGTHVAGIAVGNGRAQGNAGEPPGTFVGAAPEADIIFVRPWGVLGTAGDTNSVYLADAFNYIFHHATVLGMPCVANRSGSDDQGPHDGSSLGQQFYDNLLETPGRVIVLSAGNSNNKNSHASGQVAQSATENVVLSYLPPGTYNNPAIGYVDPGPVYDDIIEIWYDGHDRFGVAVTSPNGVTVGPVSPGFTDSGPLPSGEQITVSSILDDPRNHDNCIQIIITASNTHPIPDGNWNIAITGDTVINGRFRAWVDRNNRGHSDFQPPHLTADEMTLGDLGTTRRAITVGNLQKPVGSNPENIYASSGCGPTRDGRIKPEICAIGTQVIAPRSRNMNDADPGNFYTTKIGTSMSAPLVAGAVALLFQCRGGGLTWADMKQILADSADTTGIGIPHNAYGFGRLRMAVACAAPPTYVDVWLRNTVGDLGAEPFGLPYSWESPDIEVLDQNHLPILNPVHGIDNFVRVTVRNRGTQKARNTEVYLYWGDPATHMPFDAAWERTGIYAPVGTPPEWVKETNKIVTPVIDAGSFTSVEFRWLPPAPGTNIRGDDHFCLIARVENEADNTNIGAGEFWWPLIKNDNNITARNVHIQEISDDGDADFSFYVVGSKDKDSLWIETDLPESALSIQLPSLAMPFRSMKLVDKIRCQIPPYPGMPCFPDPFGDKRVKVEGKDTEMITGVKGAKQVELYKGVASVQAAGPKLLCFSEIRIVENSKMPVRLAVRGVKCKENVHRVRVTQFSDGRRIGGVTLELRKREKRTEQQ